MRLSTYLHDLGRTVAYHPALSPLLGGVTSTVLFCQLFWWTPEDPASDGWFGKTSDEIMEATGLTMSELVTARKTLVKLGLIQEQLRGRPPKLWFHVDRSRLDDMWDNRKEIVARLHRERLAATNKARTARAERRSEAGQTLSNPENLILCDSENLTLSNPENLILCDSEQQLSGNQRDKLSETQRNFLLHEEINTGKEKEREEKALSVFSVLMDCYKQTLSGQAATRQVEQAAVALETLRVNPERLREFLTTTTFRSVQFVKDNFLVWRENQIRQFAKNLGQTMVGAAPGVIESRVAEYRRSFEKHDAGELPEYLQIQSVPRLALVPEPAIVEPVLDKENVRTIWDNVLDALENSIEPEAFSTWFLPARFLNMDGACLTVQVPDSVFADWIWSNYESELDAAIVEAGLGDCVVEFVVAERKAA